MLPTVRPRTSLWESPLGTMEKQFDRMFRRFADDMGMPFEEQTAAYPVDLWETDDTLYLQAELPGFKRDEININLEGGMLTIDAERTTEEKKEGSEHLAERKWYKRFHRSFAVPSNIDEDQVEAHLEEGLLSITLKKREEQRGHKIEVK